MKKTKFLESKILTVALGLFIAGNVYGLLNRSLTPTDYRHCGVCVGAAVALDLENHHPVAAGTA